MANEKFPAHPIVAKLADGEEQVTRILGYFGTTTDGTVKVYPSLDDLSVYYEITEDDIRHVESAPAEELPHGGSSIWLKAGARAHRCVTQRTAVEARYLTGEMSSRMAAGPGTNAFAAARQAAGPKGQFSVWPCSVVWGACLASNDAPCAHTEQHWCPPEVATANSCFTCAGYTCVAECNSAGCPPSDLCTAARPVTACCLVWSRDVCPR